MKKGWKETVCFWHTGKGSVWNRVFSGSVKRIGGSATRVPSPRRWGKQHGRSMIEMLAVLAIIGVLSITALVGFTYAMNKHRANETIYDVMLRGTNVPMIDEYYMNKQPGHEFRFPGLPGNGTRGTYYPMVTKKDSGSSYYVEATDVTYRVCELILKMNPTDIDQIVVGNTVYQGDSDICGNTDGLAMKFCFGTNGTICNGTGHGGSSGGSGGSSGGESSGGSGGSGSGSGSGASCNPACGSCEQCVDGACEVLPCSITSCPDGQQPTGTDECGCIISCEDKCPVFTGCSGCTTETTDENGCRTCTSDQSVTVFGGSCCMTEMSCCPLTEDCGNCTPSSDCDDCSSEELVQIAIEDGETIVGSGGGSVTTDGYVYCCLSSMEDCPAGCNPVYYRDGKGYCDGCPDGTYEKNNGLWIDCVDCTQDTHCDTANCEACVSNQCQSACQEGETCDGNGTCCVNGIGTDGNCCPELTSADCETEIDENGCPVCKTSSCNSNSDCGTGESCVRNFPGSGDAWYYNNCVMIGDYSEDNIKECEELSESLSQQYPLQMAFTCCPDDKPYAIDGECRSTPVDCSETVPSGPNNAETRPFGNCECVFLRCPGYIWSE